MKKIFLFLLGIIILLIIGCFITQQTRKPITTEKIESIRIGSFSKAIDYAPYLIARNKEWLESLAKKYNTTIEYTEFQSLPPINEAIATDDIDIIFEAEPPAIIGKSAGIDLKIIGSGVNLMQEIIVRTDSNINTISDLKDKKIAVLAGTGSHYGVGKILKENELSLDDVKIIDMIPSDAKVSFESGLVDAWAVWPPFPQQEEIANKGKSLNGSEIFIQSVIVAREKFILQQPELTQELLSVIKKAQDWIIQNEKEAQQIVADELGLDLKVVERSWSKHNFKPVLEEKEIKDIQEKANFIFTLGFIKNKIDVANDLIELK